MAAGAKGKYRAWIAPDGLLRVEGWARDGLTDEMIAQKIGIATGTLYEWIKKYPEFAEALKRGKAPVDTEVENKLLQRARGYEYDEITKERLPQYDANGDLIGYAMEETKRVTKQVLPDTTAQIFWLKNRRPDMWRDRREVKGELEGSIPVVIKDDITDED